MFVGFCIFLISVFALMILLFFVCYLHAIHSVLFLYLACPTCCYLPILLCDSFCCASSQKFYCMRSFHSFVVYQSTANFMLHEISYDLAQSLLSLSRNALKCLLQLSYIYIAMLLIFFTIFNLYDSILLHRIDCDPRSLSNDPSILCSV